MRIKPFKGLVPSQSDVELVAAVPYDVVNTKEARSLAQGNPKSLLNVSRAEINFEDDIDPYSSQVYERAKTNFNALVEDNVLVRETEPCLYIYRQEMNGHIQTGIVAVSHVDDYNDNKIKKHEKTRPVKEDDRTKLAATLRAHLGPVFLTYRQSEIINKEVDEFIKANSKNVDFVANDGVRHTTWRVPGGGVFPQLFEKIPFAYVADGHHRSASAARVSTEFRGKESSELSDQDYEWFLTVFFPDNQLNVLPYNRVVKDLNGLSEDEFLEKVKELVELTVSDHEPADAVNNTKMYISGRWYNLKWDKVNDDPVHSLDVSLLQNILLAPVLGISDPRTDTRIDFIGGIRGNIEIEKLVNDGTAAVGFSMYPVKVSQLMDIADNDQIMPPKSTWFEPKLRSGLFIHTF